MSEPILPNEVAKKPLQFFYLTDWSGSMTGKKIASLNQAIREAIPAIQRATVNHPEVQIFMRAIRFADRAEWHIGPQPVELEKFLWQDLATDGCTSTATAIQMLCDEMDVERMPRRGFPPVCILVSDGFCTDPEVDYTKAVDRLNSLPWGRKAVRLSIAIGDESEYDEKQLLQFSNHPEVGLLKAHKPEELIQYIVWASVSASISASAGKSFGNATNAVNVHLPPPPVSTSGYTDVF